MILMHAIFCRELIKSEQILVQFSLVRDYNMSIYYEKNHFYEDTKSIKITDIVAPSPRLL